MNKYLPFALIYFFVNPVGLPQGLTWMALLSPVLMYFILSVRKKDVLAPYLIALLPFIIAHCYLGIHVKDYFISMTNFTCVYIFAYALQTFLTHSEDPEKIFRKLLIINFVLCLIAIPFYFTSLQGIFWIRQYLTTGYDNFVRLKMFTYEASHYATVFTPIFFFFFTQILLRQNKINSWYLFPMLFLPYILSYSLGVISAVLIAGGVVYAVHMRRMTSRKRVLAVMVLGTGLIVTMLVTVLIFLPDNSLFDRLQNIFAGKDTSGKGRTTEALFLATKLAQQKSEWWGIGLGQLKYVGFNIIRDYYLYDISYGGISIPNAVGETLAFFGWLGLTLRMGVIIGLFFYTRVWTNYFRFFLFVFVFIYQFTGSFITNYAEYAIWVLAFTNAFPQFDVLGSAVREHRPPPGLNDSLSLSI